MPSSDPFSLFSEIIMQNLEEYLGMNIDRAQLNLRYADDTEEDLQQLSEIVKAYSRKKRVLLSSTKTEVTVVSVKNECLQIIFINENKSNQRDQLKCFGIKKVCLIFSSSIYPLGKWRAVCDGPTSATPVFGRHEWARYAPHGAQPSLTGAQTSRLLYYTPASRRWAHACRYWGGKSCWLVPACLQG